MHPQYSEDVLMKQEAPGVIALLRRFSDLAPGMVWRSMQEREILCKHVDPFNAFFSSIVALVGMPTTLWQWNGSWR